MEQTNTVLEYKCPNCNAGLHFEQDTQSMTCPYCDSRFTVDEMVAHSAQQETPGEDQFQWEDTSTQNWSEDECARLVNFVCPSCAGEILSDENTAATFCPYCGNPTVLPGRVSGGLKPDGVIPFKLGKEDAQAAFRKLCKGKPLLPRFFMEEHRVEKISGIYVPFWLYDCRGKFQGQYKATRVRHWSDSNYNYTRTSYYHVARAGNAEFSRIPMDASEKMDNAIMESIEPFDYSQMVDFETAYLSGFLADKYDVPSENGQERVKQRVDSTFQNLIGSTLVGYTTCMPLTRNLSVTHGSAKYVLLPVWMLYTKYRDKTYVFAMNGQTGKMTGTFPICPKRTAAWFAGIFAGVSGLMTLILNLLG
jgi:DNA-directed RNA polymerase subunit RPC12/RpoP